MIDDLHPFDHQQQCVMTSLKRRILKPLARDPSDAASNLSEHETSERFSLVLAVRLPRPPASQEDHRGLNLTREFLHMMPGPTPHSDRHGSTFFGDSRSARSGSIRSLTSETKSAGEETKSTDTEAEEEAKRVMSRRTVIIYEHLADKVSRGASASGCAARSLCLCALDSLSVPVSMCVFLGPFVFVCSLPQSLLL